LQYIPGLAAQDSLRHGNLLPGSEEPDASGATAEQMYRIENTRDCDVSRAKLSC
jgi:hypothetical protein